MDVRPTPAQADMTLAHGVVARWTDGDTLLLEGTVHSFEAHAALLRAAQARPGVRRVYDCLVLRIQLAG